MEEHQEMSVLDDWVNTLLSALVGSILTLRAFQTKRTSFPKIHSRSGARQ
jgi:hypothetical protein